MSTELGPTVSGESSLDSFVLRFVHGADDDSRPTVAWHGVIRHVQSNRERAFNHWTDAVSFINEFVDTGASEFAACGGSSDVHPLPRQYAASQS